MQTHEPTEGETNVISIKAYKYRRYVLDKPKQEALRLATMNRHQLLLEITNHFETKRERGAE